MGRVINTNSPGKRRNQIMRTSAEILRRLSQKTQVDADVKDMVAMLIYCLREIDDGLVESVLAWEKRGYWIKVEEFRRRWQWAGESANELLVLLLDDQWDLLPQMMAKLLPHFADVTVTKLTRKETLWKGRYSELVRERSVTEE